MTDNNFPCAIKMYRVPDNARLDLLPQVFGDFFLKVESAIYAFMDQFCAAYRGGYWHYNTLSNKGFVMSLEEDGELLMENPGNYFSDRMSVEAASVAVCLFAYSLIAGVHGSEEAGEQYHLVREFALQHEEAGKILALID